MSNRLILGLAGLSALGVVLGRRGRKKDKLKQLPPCDDTVCRCTKHKLHVISESACGDAPHVGRGVQAEDQITWVAKKGIYQFGIYFTTGGELINCQSQNAQQMLMSSKADKKNPAKLTCTIAASASGSAPYDDLLCYNVTTYDTANKAVATGVDQFVRHCVGC